MATHFSILAWEIPWTEEPGGLQSMGSRRVGHHWACTDIIVVRYSSRMGRTLLSSPKWGGHGKEIRGEGKGGPRGIGMHFYLSPHCAEVSSFHPERNKRKYSPSPFSNHMTPWFKASFPGTLADKESTCEDAEEHNQYLSICSTNHI